MNTRDVKLFPASMTFSLDSFIKDIVKKDPSGTTTEEMVFLIISKINEYSQKGLRVQGNPYMRIHPDDRGDLQLTITIDEDYAQEVGLEATLGTDENGAPVVMVTLPLPNGQTQFMVLTPEQPQ